MAVYLVLCSLIFLGAGLWRLTVSLDDLWDKHEDALLARGLKPERNGLWEDNARSGGWACICVGSVCLICAVLASSTVSGANLRNSGVIIDGKELTQAEWDACGRKIERCVEDYHNRPSR